MDIKTFLSETFNRHSLIYKLSSSDSFIQLSECPFCLSRGHSNNDGFKLYIYYNSSQFHCFRCRAHGLIASLFKHIGYEEEWYKYLLYHSDAEGSHILPRIEITQESSILTKNDFIQMKERYQAKNQIYNFALEYLKERGFNLSFILNKVIVISRKDDSFSKRYFGRIIIPDVSYTGFSARDFLNKDNPDFKLRYLASDFANAFGGIINSKDTTLYITEGPLDALKMNQFGFNSFAVGGKSKFLSFFKNNLLMLKDYEPVLMIESDVMLKETNIKTTLNYIQGNFDNAYFCDLFTHGIKDPGEILNKDQILSMQIHRADKSGYTLASLKRVMEVFK